MKTTSLPAVRVEPELRQQLERVLGEGETLSSFVEASVREAVRCRMEQGEFVARGLASLQAARRSGRYVSAAAVVAKLEARLHAVRKTSTRDTAGTAGTARRRAATGKR